MLFIFYCFKYKHKNRKEWKSQNSNCFGEQICRFEYGLQNQGSLGPAYNEFGYTEQPITARNQSWTSQ